jgi:hypothetical protein
MGYLSFIYEYGVMNQILCSGSEYGESLGQ